MGQEMDVIEIVIADFVEDPVDDSAFGVNFQINGPGTKVEYLRVSFSDQFMEEYFQITWRQDLAKEEKKIQNKKRDLLIKWAVYRIEKWLEDGRKEQNIIIENDMDLIWTKKIDKGILVLKSKQKGERMFFYEMKRKEELS